MLLSMVKRYNLLVIYLTYMCYQPFSSYYRGKANSASHLFLVVAQLLICFKVPCPPAAASGFGMLQVIETWMQISLGDPLQVDRICPSRLLSTQHGCYAQTDLLSVVQMLKNFSCHPSLSEVHMMFYTVTSCFRTKRYRLAKWKPIVTG